MNSINCIPFSTKLDMLVCSNWVDFCEKETQSSIACWDVNLSQLTIYTNPVTIVNDINTIADVVRNLSSI